jgi:hypothetical protein
MTPEKTPKTFNARFDKETMWAIADLIAARYGRDKTDAVSRAIMEAKERLSAIPEYAPVVPNALPHIEPMVSQTVADTPFQPMCKHCGNHFGAFNRYASLCTDCKRNRHVGETRDCPVCTAGSGI